MERISIEQFASVTEFVDQLATRPVNKHWRDRPMSSNKEGEYRKEFAGTATYKEAEQLAIAGYDVEYTDDLKRACESIKHELSGEKTLHMERRQWYYGGAPNVPRAIIGHPRSMTQTRVTRRETPCVSIVYDVGACASVKKEQLIESGTRLACIVDALEASGIAVNLSIACVLHNKNARKAENKNFGAIVHVKNAGSALSKTRLNYFIAHPSCLRRLFFRWVETSEYTTGYASGYHYIAHQIIGEEKIAECFEKYGTYCNYSSLSSNKKAIELYKKIAGK